MCLISHQVASLSASEAAFLKVVIWMGWDGGRYPRRWLRRRMDSSLIERDITPLLAVLILSKRLGM
jgi:hypothetical protein